MSDEWQDYSAKSNDGWQDYSADQPRSAASPIAPPKLTVGAPSTQPAPEKNYLLGGEPVKPINESLNDAIKGTVTGIGHTAAMAPVALHRMMQRHGIAPQGDIYPGEHTTEQIENQDLPNAALTVLGGEPEEGGVPVGAENPKAIPIRSAEPATAAQPGMAMRVGKVLAHKIPGVKLASDLVGAIKGPEAPAVPPVRPIPPPPDFGTPQELRGTYIPVAKTIPKPPRQEILDATRENKPFAGGMDEAPSVVAKPVAKPIPVAAPSAETFPAASV